MVIHTGIRNGVARYFDLEATGLHSATIDLWMIRHISSKPRASSLEVSGM